MQIDRYRNLIGPVAECLDDDVIDMGLSISQQVAEVIAETIEEVSLMTMGYPENRMFADDECGTSSESDPVVQMLDRWMDRYTPFHRDFFQAVATR